MSSDPLDRPAPRTVDELEDNLSTPTAEVVESLSRHAGDVVILGVGGKMGPTLARMLRRASQLAGTKRRVIGVSRFGDARLAERLESWGIETLRCDLLDERQVEQLPAAPLVISMAGFKFGAAANPSLTWAMNCYLPALISRRYHDSQIVAFSSGNVYGLVPVSSGGSVETDEPRPVGEYAITILGRERMFDYFSRHLSIPTALLRLNYATELRYGVLVDIGRKVWNGEPVDISMGHVNVIWQTDANAMSLRAFDHTNVPASVLNIAGGEILRIRDVAQQFAKHMRRPVSFVGEEATDALINNASASYRRLGEPQVPAERMIAWTAEWIMQGGDCLDKPTHFESREGRF